MTKYTQEELQQIQMDLELDMHGAGIIRFDKNNQRMVDAGTPSETDWNRRLIQFFVKPMADGIQAFIDLYSGRTGRKAVALKYLQMIEPEQAAFVSIKMILDVVGSTKFDANWLTTNIGRRIEDQIRFTKLEGTAPKYVKAIKDSLAKRNSKDYDHSHKVMVATEGKLADKRNQGDYLVDLDKWVNWAEDDCKHIGAVLINIFEKAVTHEGHPIIRKETRSVPGKSGNYTLVYIVATEHVTSWIERYKEAIGCLSPAYEPCVIQPRDWTSPFSGGYYTPEVSTTMHLVKCRSKAHMRRLTRQQMPMVYSCVNSLQAVRWKINAKVLATANEISLLGLPLGMPEREPEQWREKFPCPVPEHFAELRGESLKSALGESGWAQFSEWKGVARDKYVEENERVAAFQEVIRTLGQANRYSKYDAIHFVYTLDFRGRVYCQSSLVSPQGGDLQKSLIKFADGMALGDTGFYWFAVHGANEWGWDKKPFDERVANVTSEEFKDMCKDFAADPITFSGWTKADKPWQFLSWCFEYVEYMQHVEQGGSPSAFVSFIPCAMDGSCSGIQHYSAMLRDEVGGAAVNLATFAASDGPQDIYNAVLQIVLKELNLYARGEKVADKVKLSMRQVQDIANEWIRLQPSRSLTKKPVMTLPYGSTQMTCRDHVSSWLRDLQKEENKIAKAENREPMKVHAFGDKDSSMPLMVAESLMSSIIWSSIGQVVVAARKGMAYIKAITSRVAKSNNPLEWSTPTGFIVLQAIYQKTARRVETQLMGRTDFVIATNSKDLDYHRMINSCAPNFVHSMDASHLTWSVNAFVAAGIHSIAVIHDSFGTHAGNTEKLREILRNQMADMYSQCDVIQNFFDEVEDKLLMNLDGVIIPEKGNLNLSDLRQSAYAFA